MMRGELPYFVNGKYGSVTFDPLRVARQFGFDQGVPKSLPPSGVAGDAWRRFLKSAFPAVLRPMNMITLPGATRMGGCTKLYKKYWRDNLVKDPALALFGARSPYAKEEILERVRDHLKNTCGTLEKDVGSSVSLSDRDGDDRAKGVRSSSKHTSKKPAKDVVVTSKENRESSKVAEPSVEEGAIRPSRGEASEAETGGGSAAPGEIDDIWGDEGVSAGRVLHPEKGEEESSKVIQPDVGEVAKTPRVEITGATAGEGLAVPLDSLETIGTFEQDVAVHRVMNDILEDEGVSSRKGEEGEDEEMGGEEEGEDRDEGDDQEDEEGVKRRPILTGPTRRGLAMWKKAVSAGHLFRIRRTCRRRQMKEGCAVVAVGGKKWLSTFVRLGNMSTFSRRLALISLVSFVELLEDVKLPEATPEELASVYGGLAALGGYQLEVDWLRMRIDQVARLLELPAWQDRLEKVSKELEDVEATAAWLRKRKKKLEGEVAECESALSGGFDMSSHAGPGLRR
ncbi:hypothetical protein RHMOL_Rhmol01G0229800 [Rhododendron molle]|uniref:Uncharacterized protein n=1 Tax=Rhododendron molle TaxID=49168 RepID=A0ACC0Q752_RHOML|nr:hypothetical protein RHMOL_Rhmol01G0229800 [Rhododendron molle]